ncbi:MAG: adenylyltransferase/cytidyltransferase family protein [Nitrospirae bacterium]|nr:adenylyltransferase/cytidyltransferase family protein [Nitrospirota bacterium]
MTSPQPAAARPGGKIVSLEDLARILEQGRRDGRRIAHCHGVFDLLHVGHIRHLQEARGMGDMLVVTITPDRFVNKGPGRPAFPEALRAEVVASLESVDHVAVNRWPTAVEAIKLLRPHYYVKGPDYRDDRQDVTGGITLEREAVESVGGEIRYTNDVTFSSSFLLNRHIPLFPPGVTEFLKGFREHHSASELIAAIEGLRPLRVLAVGETILDEYVYGYAIGKSSKEAVLAVQYQNRELYAGGILAIANHVAEFSEHIDLVTYLGTSDPREDFVRAGLKTGITPEFIYKEGAPTIVKRRYVDKYLLSKLLEVYEMDDRPLSPDADDRLCEVLRERMKRADVVVVGDFGHGLISPRVAEVLSREAPFLCVNTQVNAANIGFHTISKYPHADYVCIHEGEIRLDKRDRQGNIEDLVRDLSRRLGCPTINVTQGSNGSLTYRDGEGFSKCPSLALRVVDRIGAGDAVFAVTSLCAARRVPCELMGFVGNLIGAQAVAVIGNSASVDRVGLMRSVESILK